MSCWWSSEIPYLSLVCLQNCAYARWSRSRTTTKARSSSKSASASSNGQLTTELGLVRVCRQKTGSASFTTTLLGSAAVVVTGRGFHNKQWRRENSNSIFTKTQFAQPKSCLHRLNVTVFVIFRIQIELWIFICYHNYANHVVMTFYAFDLLSAVRGSYDGNQCLVSTDCSTRHLVHETPLKHGTHLA